MGLQWTLPIAMLAASVAGGAQAADIGYDCTLRVFTADSQTVIDRNFTARESGGAHAEDASQTFSSTDGRTQVVVAVDGQWIILNWSQNGAIVANAVFVLSSPSHDSRVAILYNPLNPDEQASLNCDPQTAPSGI